MLLERHLQRIADQPIDKHDQIQQTLIVRKQSPVEQLRASSDHPVQDFAAEFANNVFAK